MPLQPYLFRPEQKIDEFKTLKKIDKSKDKLAELQEKLADIQDVMFADDRYSVLICLQGMDTSGKDSLVREVFKSVNVNGINVHSFKSPTKEELAHDYLWRHYNKLPERGKITVFNRTHYENVLITRVHPEIVLLQRMAKYQTVEQINDDFHHERMEQINNFEKHLTQNGMIIIKFYLHLSKDEQKNRLLRRLKKKSKNWKFEATDLKERKMWDKYMEYYEDMLQRTSTDYAPWHVIPADDKESARVMVARVLVETLKKYDFHYPSLNETDLENLKIYEQELLHE